MEAKHTLVVMDYSTGSLKLYHFIGDAPDDPEDWLNINTDYRSSQCYWMLVNGDINREEIWIGTSGQKEN